MFTPSALRRAPQRVPAAMTREAARFGAVGFLGAGVNIAAFWLCLQVAAPIWLAAALASELSILTNFALNDRWTFGKRPRARSTYRRAARYHLGAVGGLGVTVLVATGFAAVLHLPPSVGQVVGIGAASVWNFVGTSRIAFGVWA